MVTKKERKIQKALGIPQPEAFLMGLDISVEFEEKDVNGNDIPDYIINKYNIPIGDTDYINCHELQYPIKNISHLIEQILIHFEV